MASVEASSRSWIVAQIEAREHYAVPRALHGRGFLERLYTDIWWPVAQSAFRRLPDPIRSLANRYHQDLSDASVTSFTGRFLWSKVRHRLAQTTNHQRYEHFIEVGVDFATQVRDDLRSRPAFDPDQSVYFGYDTGCLETLEFLDDTDCITIVDQIDPGRVEKEIVLEEAERWKGWASELPVLHQPYEDRLAREWERASVVVVNSEWSKTALKQQGVPSDKIRVIPLAYEPVASDRPSNSSSGSDETLTVLWLGKVILRKGIQYVVEAARLLEDRDIEFRVVGPIGITDEAIQSAPSNMTFEGPVPRDQTPNIYQSADLFVLPTLSDGFAITQLEAMAYGLPVIATPRCGRVVEDQKQGFVVPPWDVDALAESIVKLDDDRTRLEKMSGFATEKAQQFTLDRVAKNLVSIVT